jgi:GntR family transcriptional regulator/MocR family aminotransferase
MRTYPLWQHLAIDNRSGDIVGQLYSQLRAAVLAGALPRDTRVPSSRETAAMLGIARGTVTEAYARLVCDDVLTTRRGSGTFVRAAGGLADRVLEPSKHEPYASRGHRPLTPGLPALSLFPIPQWTRLYARSLRQNARDLLHYGDPQGYKPLREAIAGYLRVMRGIVADPSNILVTGGSVAAVALVASVLRKRGATAWVENPGHPPARTALECAGIRIVACPVDCGGMIIAAAARIAPRPTLALVTPAHQYPLGAALLPERKSALLGLAESRNFLIIEDDYDHEFRYDGEPSPPLKAIAPDRVVYLGTFSKLLAPGLRLGFVVAPAALVPNMVELRKASDRHPPTCVQATAAAFIQEGQLAAHVRRMRDIYSARRTAMLAALGDGVEPWGNATAPAYGLQLALRLPAECDERTVESRAGKAGLGVMALGRFWLKPRSSTESSGLLAGFADSDPIALRRSVDRLRRIVSEVRSAA